VDGSGTVLGCAGDPSPEPGDDGPVVVAGLVADALAGAGSAGAATGVAVATARAVHVLRAVGGCPGAYLHARLPVVVHPDVAARHPAVRGARTALADRALLAAVRAAAAAPPPADPGPAGPAAVARPGPAPRPRRRPDAPPGGQPALAALAAPPLAPRAALTAAALAQLTGPAGPLPRRARSAVAPVVTGRVAGLPPVAWSRDTLALRRVLAGLHRLR
jgi:hypothetical protein